MSDAIRLDINANVDGAVTGIQTVNNSAKELSGELSKAGQSGLEAGNQISDGMQKATRSTREASEAARLLGEETGVRIPRALSGILARSESIGPILNAAFSGIALIAFAELAVKAGEKLGQLIADTYIYTDAMKANYASMLQSNNELVKSIAHTKQLANERELAAAKNPAEREAIKLRQEEEGIGTAAQAQEKFNQTMARMADLRTRIGKNPIDIEWAAVTQRETDELNKLGETIPNLKQKIAELTAEEGLHTDAIKRDNQAAADEEAKEQERGLEHYKHIRAEEEKAHKESKKKEMEDNERLAEEEMKMEDEMSAYFKKAYKEREEAQEKAYEGTLNIAKAQATVNVDLAQEALARDKAAGNVTKEKSDVDALVKALEKQRDAELAILDAKMAQAQTAMNTAMTSAPGGGEDEAAYNDALAAYRNFQAERIKIAADAGKKISAANDNDLRHDMTMWNDYFNKVNAGIASTVLDVASGHETMAQVAQKAYANMLKGFIEYILKSIEMQIIAHATHQALAASEKASAASTAAAKAGQAVADIPVVGPALAVVAAATVYGALMAFDEGGMSKGGPALLHPGEAVLNPKQTEQFQKMSEGGGAARAVTFAPVVNVHGDFNADEHMPQILNGFQGWMKANGVHL